MKLILEILLMGLAMMLGSYLVPGVSVDGYGSAIIAAVLIAIANATIGLLLRVFTFPLNVLTLGLISFIITVLMILLVDNWMTGFNTSGFLAAAILAIAVSVIKMILDSIFGVDKK
ncbi:phage holin family protein [Pedobacter frigiditerrae]|uniref:Phage holin family protein n=1 Tax=Pedobacter frigiditerrae TaxID=2530452 RepID=A0A4R0N2L6_9SPHI|nr:phage holin family protein [Pedobacter frigiditerrae]TCC93543.1 phage holin family protein [Pedobacter frigiditerrae]